MTSKREIKLFLLALFLTVGVLGWGLAWLLPHTRALVARSPQNTPQNPGSPASPLAAQATPVSSVEALPSGLFSYGGSTTWAPIRQRVDLEIQKRYPQFRLSYVHPPAGKTAGTAMGLEQLYRGEIDFLQASRLPSDQELKRFQQLSGPLDVKPVGRSHKVVAVHPALKLNLQGFSLEQIEDICNGSIANWQVFGGPNLPVTVLTRASQLSKTALEGSLGDRCQSTRTIVVDTPQQALQKLSQTPGGFYINSAPLVVPQCSAQVMAIQSDGKTLYPQRQPAVLPKDCPRQRNQVNLATLNDPNYPQELIDTLYVIFRRDGGKGEQAGRAYADLLRSPEGRSLLERSGFTSVEASPAPNQGP